MAHQPHRLLRWLYAPYDPYILDALSRMPFVETAELAMILGEAHTPIHRGPSEGMVGRVSHGSAHLSLSRRYSQTAKGISKAAGVLGFDMPSDLVRAYPVSREWAGAADTPDGRCGLRLRPGGVSASEPKAAGGE